MPYTWIPVINVILPTGRIFATAFILIAIIWLGVLTVADSINV